MSGELDRIGHFGRSNGAPLRSPRPDAGSPRTVYDRIPPQNVEAEQAVLGAMLLGQGAIEKAAEMLTRADFYREGHGHIFAAMVDLHDRGEPVDAVTLKNELARRNLYDLIGGPAYIMALGDAVPTTANVGYYARIVHDKAQVRRVIETCAHLSALAYNGPEDVPAFLAEAEAQIYAIGAGRNVGTWTRMVPGLMQSLAALEERVQIGGELLGVSTGIGELDLMTSGLRRGDLIIVAGRPSMGKSALAVQMGVNAAHVHNQRAVIFSLEMSTEQILLRILSSYSGLDMKEIQQGNLTPEEHRHVLEVAAQFWEPEPPLIIDDSTAVSVRDLRARLRRIQSEEGPVSLVVVDYLQILQSDLRRPENRNEEVGTIARGLKSLAREFDVPVVALSQITRGPEKRENKRPMLSDLRDSGSLEAEADLRAFRKSLKQSGA